MPFMFRVAQYVNRRTVWLNFVKKKLGLSKLAGKLIAGTETDMKRMIESLRTDFVESQVLALRAEGVTSPDFYLLCAELMGDVVACEPIARYLKHLSPRSHIHWIVRDAFKEVVEGNPCVDETITVSSLAEGYDKALLECARKECILVNCHMDGSCCSLTKRIIHNPANPQINVLNYLQTGSLLASFSLAAGLPRLDDSPEFHFSRDFESPAEFESGYVAIHCRSSTAAKDWEERKWEDLVVRMTKRGVRVVEVGMPKCVHVDSPLYRDYTGRRNLQDVAWIIKGAAVFVGVDSGFAHVANAVKTPAVVLLGESGGSAQSGIYSGEFSRSERFVKLRPSTGKPVADIDCNDVEVVVWELLSGQSRVKENITGFRDA